MKLELKQKGGIVIVLKDFNGHTSHYRLDRFFTAEGEGLEDSGLHGRKKNISAIKH